MLSQHAVLEVEVIRIEVERRHIAQMALVLWAKVQADRGARRHREARRRWRDVPSRRHGLVRNVAVPTARTGFRNSRRPIEPPEDHGW